MQYRKEKLANNEIYHIYTRSIAKYVVFNDQNEYGRMHQLLDLYRYINFDYKYSGFMGLTESSRVEIINKLNLDSSRLVEIISFCLMPTHIHLILKQASDGGISKYMSRVLNGYSRYFNIKHQRIGPLWSSRFKSVLVSTDEQLLHLIRYIHLNPTSAGLVDEPEKWEYSSYNEYINADENINPICNFQNIIEMSPKQYQKFVDDNLDHQKKLSLIKHLMIDNYSG